MEIAATSYISDTYLERLIETLWDVWNVAGAVSLSSLGPRNLFIAHFLKISAHFLDDSPKSLLSNSANSDGDSNLTPSSRTAAPGQTQTASEETSLKD